MAVKYNFALFLNDFLPVTVPENEKNRRIFQIKITKIVHCLEWFDCFYVVNGKISDISLK